MTKKTKNLQGLRDAADSVSKGDLKKGLAVGRGEALATAPASSPDLRSSTPADLRRFGITIFPPREAAWREPTLVPIQVVRPHKTVVALRTFRIYIDHQEVTRLEDGQTWNGTITAGPHTFQARLGWCSGPKIDFSVELEPVVFTVRPPSTLRSIFLFTSLLDVTLRRHHYIRTTQS
jgi:hypothetical protein